ncbi:peptidase M16 family protein [Cumulibacter manganitolerans]|uniref:insulinase family protein n=1 Tax=Cumulibacter manganitolerans TaxID=1884992 RepID=UPI001297D0B8|nr:insulinase family protein [Cumulibacter manganitolerans]
MESTQQTSTPQAGGDVPNVLRNAATRSTIDGVTTLFAPVGGRTRATLSFRVGTSDEALHERGITHLIGHLASAAADQETRDCPVTVSASTMSFHFAGNALAVANEIGAVSHWISTAANARLDARALEKARTAAELDQRASAAEHLGVLRHRFGPRWASGSYPEHSLAQLTAEDVQAWVARYLTAQNAVLAISGTKATTLRVPLPPGEYRPVPELPAGTLTMPALLATETPTVSLSGLITTDPNRLDRDRAAAGLTTEIMRSRIGYALGRRYGRELTVQGSPMTLGPTAVHSVVWADVDAEREAKVADIAAESLTVLVSRKLVEGELEAHVKRRLAMYERAAASPRGAHELLHRQALGALNSVPWSLALERRMVGTVSADLVGSQLDSIGATTVLAMRRTDPPVRRWAEPAGGAPFTPDGEVFRSRPAYGLSARSHPTRLIIGAEGITVRSTDRPDRQERWNTIALDQRWDDGRHLLTSDYGTSLDITPETWLAPDLVVDAVRAHLPEGTSVVRMGPRSTPAPAPLKVTDRVAPAWWWAASAVAFVVAVLAVLPVWAGSLAWLRWVLLALAVVVLVVAGSWALDTALTERRLRHPGSPAPSDEPAEEPADEASAP